MTEFASKTPDRNNHLETIKTVSCFDDAKNRINNEAKWFYEANKNNPEKIQNLRTFLETQEWDRKKVEIKYIQEKNDIQKEVVVEKTKMFLYKELNISEHIWANNWQNKIRKWLIDWRSTLPEMAEDFINMDKLAFLEKIKNLDIKELVIKWYEKLVALKKDDVIAEIEKTWDNTDWPYAFWIILSWVWTIWKRKELLSWTKNLYEHSNYKFLEKYKDILWEKLEWKYLLWEWRNAVVLDYKDNPDYVLKASKEKSYVDDIQEEFKNHKVFYDSYLNLIWKSNNYGNVKIPEVQTLNREWIFKIEKINWETLYSLSARKVLKENWIELENWLSDKQIDEIISNKHSNLQSKINKQAYSDFANELGLTEFDDVLWLKYHLDQWIDNPILNLLRDIKNDTKYLHDDLHPGNIMKSKDWTYIIDYGRVRKF